MTDSTEYAGRAEKAEQAAFGRRSECPWFAGMVRESGKEESRASHGYIVSKRSPSLPPVQVQRPDTTTRFPNVLLYPSYSEAFV